MTTRATIPKSPSGGLRSGFAVLCALACLLAPLLAPGEAMAAEEPKYELRGSFGPDGGGSDDFERQGPIGIDQNTHVVYVLDRGAETLYRFDSEGNPTPFSGAAGYITGHEITGIDQTNVGESQIAVESESHEFYVTDGNAIRAFQESGEPALFTAGVGSGTSLIGGFSFLTGVAVDANGFIYASDEGANLVKVFSPLGEEVTQFAVTEPRNLAVDGNGVVYVNTRLDPTLKFTPSAFPVSGATTYSAAVEPLTKQSGVAITVDPATNNVYVTHQKIVPDFSARVDVYDESGVRIATFASSGEEGDLFRTSAGVAVDSVERAVYLSRSPAYLDDTARVLIFDIKGAFEGPPSVELTAATDISSRLATLHARVNPNFAETTYEFQYGLQDCAVSVCASVPLGGGVLAGSEVQVVSQAISGLQPGTTYHYRVVAENEFNELEQIGPTTGPSKTFRTPLEGVPFDLPDSRAWEMVSPPDKVGGRLVGLQYMGPIQAAADGNGLAYLSQGSIEPDPNGSRAVELSSVLARRGASGWTSKDISPVFGDVTPLVRGHIYKLFTPDLSRALVQPRQMSPLSPDATERTPYLWESGEPSPFRPLVTGKPGVANVPPGTVFGKRLDEAESPVSISGSNTAQSDIVLRSKVPLATGAPPFALYNWRDGRLTPLSVLPASEGGQFVGEAILGSGLGTLQNAVSQDGSRMFWSRGTYGASSDLFALHVRDTENEESGRLDVPQAGASGAGPAEPVFLGASADGAVVFFADTRKLTENASPSGADLYRCEIAPGAVEAGCANLINISGWSVESGESADVRGLPLALSEDGRRIYFVATGVLDPEPNPFGDAAVAGEPNLYLWDEAEGLRFIATLSLDDEQDWGRSAFTANNSMTYVKSSAGSPGGRFLTFMSERSLTGEDNRHPVDNEEVERVFRYDAAADRLECISCDPTGGAPRGEVLSGFIVVDPHEQWGGHRVGATVPSAISYDTEVQGSLYRSRAVLDNGRVFFNAVDPLVQADSNGEWDVYQYEPLGVGSCTPSAGDAATARSGQGCVSLLSSGTADREAGFLDAGASGDDVFFLTRAQLSVTDTDQEMDVYDARVNGVPATLNPRGECQGEACQPPIAPPADPSPASATFRGPGNPRAEKPRRCPKGKKRLVRKGKVRCAPRKHKRGNNKADKKRRAGR